MERSNRRIHFMAQKLLLPSIITTSAENGSKVWKCAKHQVSALAFIILGGSKRILGHSSKTCNEAVGGKWWYKHASMPERRYPKQFLMKNGRLNLIEEDRGSREKLPK